MVIICTEKEREDFISALLKSRECPFPCDRCCPPPLKKEWEIHDEDEEWCRYCVENRITWYVPKEPD